MLTARRVVRVIWAVARVLIALLIVSALIVGALLAAVTYRSFPALDGELTVAGLGAPVSVFRDEAGIARIYADTPHDLFMAQGFVHAQDRMWQMEVWRHISAGRLAELFGESQLETDRFVRTLGWRQAAQRDLDVLSAEARAALDAYAAGVNAWLDANNGALGMPFVVAGIQSGKGGLGGYDVEPWTPLDSAAWQKVQAWNLGGNLDEEIFRMLADERLGDPALTDQLFPPTPADAPVITPTDRIGVGLRTSAAPAPADGTAATQTPTTRGEDATAGDRLSEAEMDAWRRIALAGSRAVAMAGLSPSGSLVDDGGIGSNNWVLGPELSATGGALLANDPHLGISMPSVWYMNGLHCRAISTRCPFDVVGVSFPGAPAVVLGHNARIAWGATNVDPDVQDLYIEEPDPVDPGSYLVRGRSVPFTIRRETIRVAGGGLETLDVRETRHGPILNDVDPRLEDAPLLSLRWTATAEVDGTFDTIFRLNTAATYDEFREAMATYGSPSQHFVYADVDGHIGYQLPGLIPIRAEGDTGERPVRGDDGAHEWTGYIPFRELPWQSDPTTGLIVTANNVPTDAAYPYSLGGGWDPGDRAARILDRLDAAAADGVTVEEMREIQLDTVPLRADRMRAGLESVRAEPETAAGRELLDELEDWNGACPPESVGCGAFHATEYRLIGAVFEDELGPLARDYVGSAPSAEAVVGLFSSPDDPWWDDVRTRDVTESAADIVARAIDRAAAELQAAFPAPATWSWGTLHQAPFREETLGTSGIDPLESYFNRGPVAAPGAAGAILNTYHRPSRGYADPEDPEFEPLGLDRVFNVAVLPSYRLTIDMDDLDGARIIQTTGQSGNPYDRHYGDLIDRWTRGETLPLPWDRRAVERSATDTLTLRP